MAKNSILIDGSKLKRIIEGKLGLSVYSISEANGYSRNLVAQAIRSGKASPLVQNLLRLYSVAPEEYEYKEPITEAPEREQISIEDITPLNRDKIKEIVKEAFKEAFKELSEEGVLIIYDPVTMSYHLKFRRSN